MFRTLAFHLVMYLEVRKLIVMKILVCFDSMQNVIGPASALVGLRLLEDRCLRDR